MHVVPPIACPGQLTQGTPEERKVLQDIAFNSFGGGLLTACAALGAAHLVTGRRMLLASHMFQIHMC